MAKYASLVRSTVADAGVYEKAGDTERATLLYMRCMLLVCKTITAHPEYAVQENKAIRRDLAGLAGNCLQKLEMLAAPQPGNLNAAGDNEDIVPQSAALKEPPSQSEMIPMSSIHTESDSSVSLGRLILKRPRVRALVVSERLVSLFERIAAANGASGTETIGVLAGRLSTDEDTGAVKTIESITQHLAADSNDDAKESPIEVSALVIPSQRPATGNRSEAEVLHETDIANLLTAKGLVQLGWILRRPENDFPLVLDSLAAHRQLRVQSHVPSAATLLAVPGRAIPLTLSDPLGMEVVAACAVSTPHEHDGLSDITAQHHVDRTGEAGSSKSDATLADGTRRRLVVQAEHVKMCQDPDAVQFKLYDVRPLGTRHGEDNATSGIAMAR
jgi:hypothetical protein